MSNYLPPSEFQCRRKVSYKTEEDAKGAERIARKVRGERWLRTYFCRYCRGYHMGHVLNWKSLDKLARERGITK